MLRIILFFGLISLLGDLVYEGARSVYGPFFRSLGVDPFTFGLIIGFGEFLAYGFRVVSGYLSDRFRGYWFFTIAGYITIVAIPLMGFVGSWFLASILLIVERFGKGLRTPARDTILSFVTEKVGRGFGFGIHEALDQIGAVLGPILFSILVIYGYGVAFKWTLIPFLAMFALLIYLRLKLPNPESLECKKMDGIFGIYLIFVFLCGLGFVNYPLIAYHYSKEFSESMIPLLYAFAMVVDAAFAPIVGKFYDSVGLKILLVIPTITIISFFSFFNPIALLFFGLAMAMHETVMKAVIADYVGVSKRSTAYGIFNASYGLSLFIGSSIVGFLYPNFLQIFTFVLAVEILGIAYAIMIARSIHF